MEVQLFKAGIDRIMIMGVPRKVAILEGTAAAAFVFGLHNFLILPVVIIVHLIIQRIYKNDPYFLEILNQHILEDDFLEP